MFQDRLEKAVRSLLDDASRLQAPAVAGYVDRLRRAHPQDTPAALIDRLSRHYVATVTSSGGAVGATAAVPGVGTLTALTAMGAETAFFLEASALYTLAVAAVHGIAPEDHERRRALVLAVVLGESGMQIVEQRVGHSARDWPSVLASRIPGISSMNDSLLKKFVVQFLTKRSVLAVGKVIPAGIGAAIGGFGNRALGRSIVAHAADAFGPPPRNWPHPSGFDGGVRRSAAVIDADPVPDGHP